MQQQQQQPRDDGCFLCTILNALVGIKSLKWPASSDWLYDTSSPYLDQSVRAKQQPQPEWGSIHQLTKDGVWTRKHFFIEFLCPIASHGQLWDSYVITNPHASTYLLVLAKCLTYLDTYLHSNHWHSLHTCLSYSPPPTAWVSYLGSV
jgi:hypothetical protein